MSKHNTEEGPNAAGKAGASKVLAECLSLDPKNVLDNPFLIARTGLIAKLLLLADLSERIKSVPGDVIEFGVWYGQTLILLENLRAINEPFNFSRNFFGFDTFEGYRESSGLNIKEEEQQKYDTGLGWADDLKRLFDAHVSMNRSLTELNLVPGDVTKTVPDFFSSYENFVALSYIDIATYQTTNVVLSHLIPFVPTGGIIVIDDFGPQYPGVSKALHGCDLNDFSFEVCPFYPSKVMLIRR